VKLKKVQIQMFRNIIDSTEVEIEPHITCLVGKNESGKSAFLHALWRFNPASTRSSEEFSVPEQYPAWLEKKHRREGRDLENFYPVTVHLEWQPEDVKLIEEKFGPGVIETGAILELSKSYSNKFFGPDPYNEKKAVSNFLSQVELPGDLSAAYVKIETFEALQTRFLNDQKANEEKEGQEETVRMLQDAQKGLQALLGKGKTFAGVCWEVAESRLPEFFYFAEYSKLPYSVKINDILKSNNLAEHEATARALLLMGGTEQEYMLNPDYERRKRELENVANALTEDVNKYWSQNPELRVAPDITTRNEARGNGQHAVLDELKLRIWDNRHQLSLPFTEHSAGFQWFYSFLAAFSEYEHQNPPVVILLDEPAVGLHAKAQADFLRFIEERLATRCQVIYTTHSPFMVQPGRLERVRMVEDHGKDEGSTVTSDVLSRDPDTLFPLQGALGYDLVQHLFVAEHNLVVEGTSDYAYLKVISDFLEGSGRGHLDPKWSIVPVGGADAVPTFVALLGTHLNVTVVLDSRKEGHQRLTRMSQAGQLDKKRIILVGEVIGKRLGDIEDLFEPQEYLDLYNRAFKAKIKVSDLNGDDQIVSRIARHLGVERYDHGKPADVLLRERGEIIGKLSDATLKRFEDLFARINRTLAS